MACVPASLQAMVVTVKYFDVTGEDMPPTERRLHKPLVEMRQVLVAAGRRLPRGREA